MNFRFPFISVFEKVWDCGKWAGTKESIFKDYHSFKDNSPGFTVTYFVY